MSLTGLNYFKSIKTRFMKKKLQHAVLLLATVSLFVLSCQKESMKMGI